MISGAAQHVAISVLLMLLQAGKYSNVTAQPDEERCEVQMGRQLN